VDDVDATELRIVRAESLLKLERYVEAEADLDLAIERKPDHLHAFVHRCEARRLQVRDCWVTLRARWVALRARWVTLRARWVTLRARWVIREELAG
jgi:hypothetical protein